MKTILLIAFAITLASAKKEHSDIIGGILDDPKLAAEFFKVVKRLGIDIPEKRPQADDAKHATCRNNVYKNTIIRTSDSRKAGAKFLRSVENVKSNEQCFSECCKTDGCDLSVYGEGNKTKHNCYLFHCKDELTNENKCLFNNYTGYVSSTVSKIRSPQGKPVSKTADNTQDIDSLKDWQEPQTTTFLPPTTSTSKPTPPPTERPHTVALGGVCHSKFSCEDPNAQCSHGVCQCRDVFYKKQDVCRQICIADKEFECRSRGTSRRGPDCIKVSLVCDGTHHCADGSDELNCPTDVATMEQSPWLSKSSSQHSDEETSVEDNKFEGQMSSSDTSDSSRDRSQYGYPPLDRAMDWDYTGDNSEDRSDQLENPFQLKNLKPNSPVTSSTDSYPSHSKSIDESVDNELKTYDSKKEDLKPKHTMPIISWAGDDGEEDRKTQSKQTLQDQLSSSLKDPFNDLESQRGDDLESQRGDDLESQRVDDVESQRGDDVESQRGNDLESQRGDDVESQRGNDLESQRGDDVESQRGDDLESQRGDDLESHRGGDVESQEGDDLESQRGDDVESQRGDDVESQRGGDVESQRGDDVSQDRSPSIDRHKSTQYLPIPSKPRGDRPEALPHPTQPVQPSPGITIPREPIPKTEVDDGEDRKSHHFDSEDWSDFVKNGDLPPPLKPVDSTPDLPYSTDQLDYQQPLPYRHGRPYQPSPPRYGPSQPSQPRYGANQQPASRYGPNQPGRYPNYRYPGYNQQYTGYNMDYQDYDPYFPDQDQDLTHPDIQAPVEPSYVKGNPGGGYRPKAGQPGRLSDHGIGRPAVDKNHEPSDKSLEQPQLKTPHQLPSTDIETNKPGSDSVEETHSKFDDTSSTKNNKVDTNIHRKTSPTNTDTVKADKGKDASTSKVNDKTPHKADLPAVKPSKPKQHPAKSHSDNKAKTETKIEKSKVNVVKAKETFVTKKVIVASLTDSAEGPIVALSLGLAITLVLLVFVGCRLRNVRRRLRKGRPLHSNEADYLINGMYL